jgi:hypothetical protein
MHNAHAPPPLLWGPWNCIELYVCLRLQCKRLLWTLKRKSAHSPHVKSPSLPPPPLLWVLYSVYIYISLMYIYMWKYIYVQHIWCVLCIVQSQIKLTIYGCVDVCACIYTVGLFWFRCSSVVESYIQHKSSLRSKIEMYKIPHYILLGQVFI